MLSTEAKIAVIVGAGAILLIKVYREIAKGLSTPDVEDQASGGELIAKTLKKQGVKHIFCLSGGHIAPVYVEAQNAGIQVIDVRHEVNSVFAADAVARVTGVPGVAAVTAGPGVTNTITAIKNAQMAESPLIVLGGCTSIVLMGRGSLQDIDHMSLMKSLVKWSCSPRSVKELIPAIERAFVECQEGVPGPVFIELPMDLLWPPKVTVETVAAMMPKGNALMPRLARWYLRRHITTIFTDATINQPKERYVAPKYFPSKSQVKAVAAALKKAQKPVLLVGSQAMLCHERVGELREAVAKMGIPVFLNGMARGLLGANGENVQFMHNRTMALKSADLVIFAGVIADFRVQYGFAVNPRATFITVNRSAALGKMNRSPTIGVVADPALFLMELATVYQAGDCLNKWKEVCLANEAEKERSIAKNASTKPPKMMNPVAVCIEVNKAMSDDAVVCVDGGDFVGTAAYTIHPRGPFGWLDPGPFGTLGVGAGFAMGVKAADRSKEVWIVYGDGALGFSLMEFDTMVRHKLGVIAVVGNDAVWAQMIRDQQRLLGSECACNLNRTDYHAAVEALGGKGFLVDRIDKLEQTLLQAKQLAREGVPVLINCHIARNDFREGSISV